MRELLFLAAIDANTFTVFLIVVGLIAAGALYWIGTQRNLLRNQKTEIKTLAEENKNKTSILESREQKLNRLETELKTLREKLAEVQGQNSAHKSEISRQEKALLEKAEKLTEARLEKLNYELSPHAFKNTLNTIKGMAFRMNLAMETLTDLLNYMLYETKKKHVSLAAELEFIDHYIAMNDLMTSPWVSITKDFSDIDDAFAKRMAIAPLITIYFAENAFKHAKQDGKDCFIKFSIRKVGENQVIYTVTNKRFINSIPKKQSGVGSLNLQQRLDLLYPDRYILEAQPIDDLFIATLTLTLEPYENPVPVSG